VETSGAAHRARTDFISVTAMARAAGQALGRHLPAPFALGYEPAQPGELRLSAEPASPPPAAEVVRTICSVADYGIYEGHDHDRGCAPSSRAESIWTSPSPEARRFEQVGSAPGG